MQTQHDHNIDLRIIDDGTDRLAAIIEATCLFVDGFVEGESVHDRTFIYNFERHSLTDYRILVKSRYPIPDARFDHDAAFGHLYLIFVGWYLAGADVEVQGCWKIAFPGKGCLKHKEQTELALRGMFEDELPKEMRTKFPDPETLSKVFRALPHRGSWNEVQREEKFQESFLEYTVHPKSSNDICLQHRSGWKIDLILKNGQIHAHRFQSVQPEVASEAGRVRCDREISNARTWWDAWIGLCGTKDVSPKRLLKLPGEIAIFAHSIHRYRIADIDSLANPQVVDFGPGFNPRWDVDYWLGLSDRFGNEGYVDIAIACSQQALATANAIKVKSPGAQLALPIGRTVGDLVDAAEVEYLRWLDRKESLEKHPVPHSRWEEKIKSYNLKKLRALVGEVWHVAIDDLVAAISQEHADSEDYHRKIGHIRECSWNVGGEFGKLRYSRLFGSDLMDSKLPRSALAALGYKISGDVIASHLEFEDIFTLTLGNERFWGTVTSRALVDCARPEDVYRLK